MMTENKITSSLIYQIKEEREKRSQKQLRQKMHSDIQHELDKIKFSVNYHDNEQKNIHKHENYYKALKKYKDMTFHKKISYQKKSSQCMNLLPNKVSVQFEFFNPKKHKNKDREHSKEDSIHAIKLHQYLDYVTLSKDKYYDQIEKKNQKKIQKCKFIGSFGLNIKQVKHSSIETLQQNTEKLQRKVQVVEQSTRSMAQIENKKYQIKATKSNKSHFVHPFEKEKLQLSYNQTSTVQIKIKRMLKSMEIICNSFTSFLKIEKPLDSIQNKGKFTYFIGKGNNKNLIVSIMKKRWWWIQSEEKETANLIWTQLKHTESIQKQKSIYFYQDFSMPPPQKFEEKKSYSPSIDQNIKDIMKKLFNIFHPKFKKQFYLKLSEAEKQKSLRHFQTPQCVTNHFISNFMLGNKNALFHNLSSYFTYKKENIFDIVPLTFYVEGINSKSFKEFEKNIKNLKDQIWIVKPGQNSNRGKGIFVCDNISEIKKKIEKKKDQSFIIQKYVKNIFLFHQRKFDIRTYLLKLSLNGVTKFFWYSEGYLRTSSQIFDLSDLSDNFIHLTNDAIQIKSESYGKYEKGNKITYNQFQRYLDCYHADEKLQVKKVVESMKSIAKQVVMSTYFKLDPHNKIYGFQLFGMDFLIDSNFKPWLLEVNTNPCLELSSPTLERLIPRMIQNLFRIAVDPVYRPTEENIPKHCAYYIYENSIDSNRFQLIFDSLFDQDPQWQAYSKEEGEKIQYQDEDDVFQDDGQIINIDFN